MDHQKKSKRPLMVPNRVFEFVCRWWTIQSSETGRSRTRCRVTEHRHMNDNKLPHHCCSVWTRQQHRLAACRRLSCVCSSSWTRNWKHFSSLLQKGNAGLWLLRSDSGSFSSSGLQPSQRRSPAGAGQQHHRQTEMSAQPHLFCFLFLSSTRNDSLRN